jgi:hypothetical protein
MGGSQAHSQTLNRFIFPLSKLNTDGTTLVYGKKQITSLSAFDTQSHSLFTACTSTVSAKSHHQ